METTKKKIPAEQFNWYLNQVGQTLLTVALKKSTLSSPFKPSILTARHFGGGRQRRKGTFVGSISYMDEGDRSDQQAPPFANAQVEEIACKLIARISHVGNNHFWFFKVL